MLLQKGIPALMLDSVGLQRPCIITQEQQWKILSVCILEWCLQRTNLELDRMLAEIQMMQLQHPTRQRSSHRLPSSLGPSGGLSQGICSLQFGILCPILSRLLRLTFITFLSLPSALLTLLHTQTSHRVLGTKEFHKTSCKRLYQLVVRRMAKMALQTAVIT